MFGKHHSEKENTLYPAVFMITGYLGSAYHWSIIAISQRVVLVLYERFLL